MKPGARGSDHSHRSSRRPGFHEGELAVQRAEGVGDQAARLSRMLDPPDLSGGATGFLAAQSFAVLVGRDLAGRLWASPLVGTPGFLEASGPTTLTVHAVPNIGDPLHDLPVGQQVGLIVIDPSRRRRYRVNGWLDATQLLPGGAALLIEADQAYGNCPQFIQQRELAPVENPAGEGVSEVHRAVSGDSLSAADRAQVQAADTFFLGTAHPERGTDASHRGGPAGFVRVTDEQHLWWPDYAGNNMFNSLGNLASDPSAALLFVDFSTGATLHLSGTAKLEHTVPGAPGDDGRTGRRISFALEAAVPGARMALRAANTAGYPRNPVLTDR